jgi:drug/metabolite transporter (DMT)-like permease
LLVLLWGSSFPVIERLLMTWDVLSVTAGRHFIGACTMAVILTLSERRLPFKRSLPWRKLIVLGVFGMALSAMIMTLAIFYAGAVGAAVIAAAGPIVAAITGRLVFAMPMFRGILVGTVLAVGGGLVVVFGGGGAVDFKGGELLVMLSTVTWTWYSIGAQRWLHGLTQLQIAALTMAPGSVALVIIAVVVATTGLAEPSLDFSPPSLALLIYLGALPIGVGNWLWHYGVSRVGIHVATMYINMIPIAAVLVSMAFGSFPGPHHLIGGIIIVAGVTYTQFVVGKRTRAAAL